MSMNWVPVDERGRGKLRDQECVDERGFREVGDTECVEVVDVCKDNI